MKPGWPAIIFALLLATALQSQQFEPPLYRQRDSSIRHHMAAEDYSRARELIEEQIAYLRASGRYDSLFRLTYPRGRAWWKTAGRDEGVKRLLDLKEEIFARDPDTLHLLDVLNDLTWIYYETGQVAKCLPTDSLVLKLTQKYTGARPVDHYTAYYNLAFDHIEMGNTRAAVTNFEHSARVIMADSGKYPDRLADAYNGLGATRYRRGEFRKAREAFAAALRFAGRLEDSLASHAHRANIWGNLSLIAQDEHKIVEARQSLEKAIEHRNKALTLAPEAYLKDRERDHLMANYRALAAIYLELGQYAKAERIIQYVKTQRQSYLEDGDTRLEMQHESLGSIYLAQGQYSRALQYLEPYLQAVLEQQGRGSFLTGKAFKRVGQVHSALENWEEAARHFSEAIEIFERTESGEEGRELALCHLERARVNTHLGHWSQATADAQQALQIFRKAREANDPEIGRALLGLVRVHQHFEKWPEAENFCRQAREHLQSSYRKRATGAGGLPGQLNPFLPEAYRLSARQELRGSTAPDILQVERAWQWLRQGLDLMRQQSHLLVADESHLWYNETHQPLFNDAQKILLKAYRLSADQDYLKKLYLLEEESRSVLLRRQLQQLRSLRYAGVPDSLQRREQQLLGLMSRQLPHDTAMAGLLKYEHEYDDLTRLYRQKYPEYYRLRFSDSLADWSELRNTWLDSAATWLQFIDVEDSLLALIITLDQVHLVALDTHQLSRQIQQFNEAIAHANASRSAALSQELYARLIAPLESFLQGDQLYIVPDGELYRLNFESLRPTGGKYLLEHFAIAYLPSATSALRYRQLRRGKLRHSVLAVAPGFSEDQKNYYRQIWGDSLLREQGFLQRLQQPFAVRTAQGLARYFPARVLLHRDATERQFREQAARHGIIHLGTHTEINENSPLYSRLVLSWPEGAADEKDDGFLHAYEIYDMALRAELAVLTACETGRGQYSSSEGAMSLAHSFAYAGCPSVVMSLWQIDEKTSADILDAFYHYLRQGFPKHRALQRAKLDFLAQEPEELQQPYYWAGLVLLGDHQALALKDGVGTVWFNWMYWGGALILASFFIVWMARKKRSRPGAD